MFLKLERLPQIVIARVNGAATGAGCVFAYSCDFRIAASTSQFGMPEINLGWAPGYGLAQLAGLIGKSRAMDLCLTGRIINARQALEWGLVNEVVAPALLERRAGEFVERLLAQPAQGLRETKRQLHLTDGAAAKLAYRGDTEAYLRCFDGPDAKEGIVAFREKRAPRFSQL
jgi:enoyl-CoA hydratase